MLLRFLKKVKYKFKSLIGRGLSLVKVHNSHSHIVRLGSPYGGWSFCDISSINGGVVISCGAGEDISFDVEMALKYETNVFIVDPTPRSLPG